MLITLLTQFSVTKNSESVILPAYWHTLKKLFDLNAKEDLPHSGFSSTRRDGRLLMCLQLGFAVNLPPCLRS
jgi:hypothetical protein